MDVLVVVGIVLRVARIAGVSVGEWGVEALEARTPPSRSGSFSTQRRHRRPPHGRPWGLKGQADKDWKARQSEMLAALLPTLTDDAVAAHLEERRFLVLEGPPPPCEVGEPDREIELPHPVDGKRSLRLSPGLMVLGTRNTADRSDR